MKNVVKGLQRQLTVKQKEIVELKAENEQLKKQQIVKNQKTVKISGIYILEAFVLVLLFGIGVSALENGLATMFYPCDGQLCAEIFVAGTIRFAIGSILIMFAFIIILFVNIFKGSPEEK